jgi:Ca2+:H+ antiporter
VLRRLLWASLGLAPVVVVARFVFDADETVLFVLSALALVPLAWLIGEATEHAGEHTGAGVAGFLNASFGNAPELIIGLFAIASGLPDVVRGSITGSIVGNVLLVLGFALVVGPASRIDRRSLLTQLGLIGFAVALFLVPSVPGFHGDPNRHELAVLSLPVAGALILVYVALTVRNLRLHRSAHADSGHEPDEAGWSLAASLVALGVATAVTAVISEILVHTLESFAHAAGVSQFFIATVIVAIVGNAAEHGGAVVIASRDKMRLASEIALSSGAQVALLVAGGLAILSWAIEPLSLAFRPVELVTLAGAALVALLVVSDGRTVRLEGALLIGVYVACAATYFAVGDR